MLQIVAGDSSRVTMVNAFLGCTTATAFLTARTAVMNSFAVSVDMQCDCIIACSNTTSAKCSYRAMHVVQSAVLLS